MNEHLMHPRLLAQAKTRGESVSVSSGTGRGANTGVRMHSRERAHGLLVWSSELVGCLFGIACVTATRTKAGVEMLCTAVHTAPLVRKDFRLQYLGNVSVYRLESVLLSLCLSSVPPPLHSRFLSLSLCTPL